jgi:S-adenosylmethionine:tRNA ribosyltransferase-isomerase
MATQQQIVYQCLVGNAKRWREGQLLTLNITINSRIIVLKAKKLERLGTSFLVAFVWNSHHSFSEILEAAGKMPLPPYLNRDSTENDKQTYQTIYAQHDGSVAAPTAGLHFTESLLETFAKKGINLLETTLHVGAGTFKPVQTTHVQDHTMHHEEIHITAQFISDLIHANGSVIAVGTTSTRTLESLYWLGVKHVKLGGLFEDELYLNQWEAYELPQNISKKEALQSLLNYMANKGISQLYSHTQLMILPGYRFRVIDGLFTNFHQPASTLILLVAAAVGNNWRNIYNHALANNYRFLSYGDGSLLFVDKGNIH